MSNKRFYCSRCGSSNLRKHSKYDNKQRWECKECGRRSVFVNNFSIKNQIVKNAPVVYVLDIETSPMEVFVWDLFKQRISPKNVIADTNVICWTAKKLFGSEVLSYVQTPEEARRRDDKRIIKPLFKLLDRADFIIAHNGERFDLPKINARMIFNGCKRPFPYQIIDTYKLSRKTLGFSSKSLNYLSKLLMNKEKISTNFELWIRCIRGEEEALEEMRKYNVEDVMLLEEVYAKLRNWFPSHPNLSVFNETSNSQCPVCLSHKLDWGGTYGTPAGRYVSFRCKNCGSIGRSRYNDYQKEYKRALVLSVAR